MMNMRIMMSLILILTELWQNRLSRMEKLPFIHPIKSVNDIVLTVENDTEKQNE